MPELPNPSASTLNRAGRFKVGPVDIGVQVSKPREPRIHTAAFGDVLDRNARLVARARPTASEIPASRSKAEDESPIKLQGGITAATCSIYGA
jgi:hypothetical protein